MKNIKYDLKILTILITSLFTSIIIGTLIFSLIEGWDFLDSFYFTMITMLSVGYGDLAPTTTLTKMLSVLYAILGILLIFLTVGLIFEVLITHIRNKRD